MQPPFGTEGIVFDKNSCLFFIGISLDTRNYSQIIEIRTTAFAKKLKNISKKTCGFIEKFNQNSYEHKTYN